jgi:hypothetical protein
LQFTFWAEWWGFVFEVMLSTPFILFSLWTVTIGERRLLPRVAPLPLSLALPRMVHGNLLLGTPSA